MSEPLALRSDASPLTNRLLKNARHLARWARREGLEAYRLYDRDIPEYPYAVDRYGEWLNVQLFEGKRPLADAEIAAHVAAIASALAVSPDQAVLKIRRRQRGMAQYEKLDTDGHAFVIRERGLRFEINLQNYLDSGLFLDHRETRRLVGADAEGARVLNLFAYTGSFSVYAAAGGAQTTTTVDLSHTYQAWAARNLELNDFTDRSRHRLIAADVQRYLVHAAARRERFDLIVLDAPSFSNSKRMQESFDIQRDHGALLLATLGVLAPAGTLYFANNRQGFKLDLDLTASAWFENITARTLPADFQRHRPHQCWRVRHA